MGNHPRAGDPGVPAGDSPHFQAIDEIQLDNNNVTEATPSGPGPNLTSFNDCTWATTRAAP